MHTDHHTGARGTPHRNLRRHAAARAHPAAAPACRPRHAPAGV